MPPRDLYQASAEAYVAKHIRLLPTTVDHFAVANHLAILSAIQDKRAEIGAPKLFEPLLWLAIARAAGLEVSDMGMIIGGPQVPDEAVRP